MLVRCGLIPRLNAVRSSCVCCGGCVPLLFVHQAMHKPLTAQHAYLGPALQTMQVKISNKSHQLDQWSIHLNVLYNLSLKYCRYVSEHKSGTGHSQRMWSRPTIQVAQDVLKYEMDERDKREQNLKRQLYTLHRSALDYSNILRMFGEGGTLTHHVLFVGGERE